MYKQGLLRLCPLLKRSALKECNKGRYEVWSKNSKRLKYDQNTGVKGIRNRKHHYENLLKLENENFEEQLVQTFNLEDSEYELMAHGAMYVSRNFSSTHNVLIVQPYVKWGPQRNLSFSPDDQLKEAEALIRSLPNWNIALSLKVPLESLERKTLFGKGKLEELKALVTDLRSQTCTQNQKPLTCVFVSKGSLTFTQKSLLEAIFKVPVMDRYSVVVQILRLHATTAEARLQVAMAEIPYIWAQAKEANPSKSSRIGYALTDIQREVLRTRERKLKQELERIRTHRKLLRNKRKQHNYPVVAVVGYTNVGKTSLIKALTQEQKMQPKDRLFATLDVTAHGGVLPCNLEVVYMDTVGFMSDIPTGLIECFVATLEDALLADVILHVQDASHTCFKAQREHVENTLKLLTDNINDYYNEERARLPPIINVANKIDLMLNLQQHKQKQQQQQFNDLLKVSSKTLLGVPELLNELENNILRVTGRRKITIKVKNGGTEMAWLHKNTAVVRMRPDHNNVDLMLIDVVITDIVLQQFKRQFCQ